MTWRYPAVVSSSDLYRAWTSVTLLEKKGAASLTLPRCCCFSGVWFWVMAVLCPLWELNVPKYTGAFLVWGQTFIASHIDVYWPFLYPFLIIIQILPFLFRKDWPSSGVKWQFCPGMVVNHRHVSYKLHALHLNIIAWILCFWLLVFPIDYDLTNRTFWVSLSP